jgi:hypothetical protein
MSIESVIARINTLNAALTPPAPPVAPPPSAPVPPAGTASASASPTSFASMLQQAGAPQPTAPGQGAGAALLRAVQGEVGQKEQPPGSNDSARIAQYRSAVPGGGVGPWCAYFASWAARQAGTPLGDNGQGFGRVDDVWSWAQSAGRAVPGGQGASPKPGDLIIWDEHMGVVEAVLPDGSIQTIEGNSSDQVARRVHAPSEPLVGFVSMS